MDGLGSWNIFLWLAGSMVGENRQWSAKTLQIYFLGHGAASNNLPLLCAAQVLEVRKMRGHEQRLAWFLHCFFWAFYFPAFWSKAGTFMQINRLRLNRTTFPGALKSAQGPRWHGKEPVKLFKGKRIALRVTNNFYWKKKQRYLN